ncbi:uncharacterized protein LOC110701338 [Chenopodium quinoa]|uniref:uncharacterized protein LOC110701338 n=1 Tax=Chenopodium quinoa TaxID=63459 RepID=UPI000B791E08|nr:uncharacterized protein LOC110701338 [Chenopodium quinoa]
MGLINYSWKKTCFTVQILVTENSSSEEENAQTEDATNQQIPHDGELPREILTQQAKKFNVHRSTLSRLFKRIKKQINKGNVIDVRSNKLGRCGPKPTEYSDEFLMSFPLYKRITKRSYAAALKISHVTLHKLGKKGRLRTHTSTNHPSLTSNNMIARIKWALAHINPIPAEGNPKFVNMQQVIHIDEKWFYLNLEERNLYLLLKEKDPYRCQQ